MRSKTFIIYVSIILFLSCSVDNNSEKSIYENSENAVCNDSCLDAVSFNFSENTLNVKKDDRIILSSPINSTQNLFILVDTLRQRLFSTFNQSVYLFDCRKDRIMQFEDSDYPIKENESRLLDTINGKYTLNLRNAFYLFDKNLKPEYSSWNSIETKKLDTIDSFDKYLIVDLYQHKNKFVDTIYVFFSGVNTMSRYKFTDTIIFEK